MQGDWTYWPDLEDDPLIELIAALRDGTEFGPHQSQLEARHYLGARYLESMSAVYVEIAYLLGPRVKPFYRDRNELEHVTAIHPMTWYHENGIPNMISLTYDQMVERDIYYRAHVVVPVVVATTAQQVKDRFVNGVVEYYEEFNLYDDERRSIQTLERIAALIWQTLHRPMLMQQVIVEQTPQPIAEELMEMLAMPPSLSYSEFSSQPEISFSE